MREGGEERQAGDERKGKANEDTKKINLLVTFLTSEWFSCTEAFTHRLG